MLGILPGVIGLIQATETVKLILGIGEPLIGRLLRYDALEMRFREYKIRRNPECPVCGDHPTVTTLIDYQQFCGMPAHDAAATAQAIAGEIDAKQLKAKFDRNEHFTLLDVREPHEYQIARIAGATLIPLNDLSKRIQELTPSDEIVVHCKGGTRSAKAIEFLKQGGFTNLLNLRGGILSWSDQVDPRVPKY